jgi:hypothetical protein
MQKPYEGKNKEQTLTPGTCSYKTRLPSLYSWLIGYTEIGGIFQPWFHLWIKIDLRREPLD